MHLCQSQHSAECGVVVLGSLPKKKEYKPLSIPLVCLLGLEHNSWSWSSHVGPWRVHAKDGRTAKRSLVPGDSGATTQALECLPLDYF